MNGKRNVRQGCWTPYAYVYNPGMDCLKLFFLMWTNLHIILPPLPFFFFLSLAKSKAKKKLDSHVN